MINDAEGLVNEVEETRIKKAGNTRLRIQEDKNQGQEGKEQEYIREGVRRIRIKNTRSEGSRHKNARIKEQEDKDQEIQETRSKNQEKS